MKTSRKLSLLASAVLATAVAAPAQSTSGSSGKGTTEPGASAAEASSFGNTSRSPSVTGSNDPAPQVPAAGSNLTAPGAKAPTNFHGAGINAEAIFRKLDVNGDGQLSREEFAQVQTILGVRSAGEPAATKKGQ